MIIFKKSIDLASEFYRSLGVTLLAFVIYLSVIIISYTCYDQEFKDRKDETLNNYYEIIYRLSLYKFNQFLNKLSSDYRRSNTILSIDQSDIKGCYKHQCVKDNLFEFISSIDNYIPNFIYYRIEVNKQMLYRNARINDYELAKTHHIDTNNQISILLSADTEYWYKVKIQTIKPFLITVISSTFLLILFIISNKLLNRYIKNFYFTYYKNHYEVKLEQIKKDYQKELNTKENSLMKRIWDLEYSKDRDTELNYLFSQAANKLAMLMQGVEYSNINFIDKNKNAPCTIILYYSNNKEIVNIKQLIEVFSNRFINSEDNISILITSLEQNVKFVSRESLYQIIYGIINFIIFVLKTQPGNIHYNLKFNITNKQDKLSLLFEYDGLAIYSEEDMLGFSNRSMQKNANPFLLSIKQIFHILRANNFHCTVGCLGDWNFIKITKDIEVKNINEKKSNIIQLPTRHE